MQIVCLEWEWKEEGFFQMKLSIVWWVLNRFDKKVILEVVGIRSVHLLSLQEPDLILLDQVQLNAKEEL